MKVSKMSVVMLSCLIGVITMFVSGCCSCIYNCCSCKCKDERQQPPPTAKRPPHHQRCKRCMEVKNKQRQYNRPPVMKPNALTPPPAVQVAPRENI